MDTDDDRHPARSIWPSANPTSTSMALMGNVVAVWI